MLVKRVYNIKQTFTWFNDRYRFTDSEGINKKFKNNIKSLIFIPDRIKVINVSR